MPCIGGRSRQISTLWKAGLLDCYAYRTYRRPLERFCDGVIAESVQRLLQKSDILYPVDQAIRPNSIANVSITVWRLQ
jgi:hypothetical protein